MQFFPAKVTAALLRASRAALCAPARVVRIADAAARASRTPRGREIELAVETADGAAPAPLRCRPSSSRPSVGAELLPELAPWLRPTRNQVLMTSPIANRPGPAWSGVGGVSVDEGARELYAIARADGRVCVGGARSLEPGAAIGSTDDASLSDEVGAHLRAFLRDAFPRSFGAESAPGSWRVEAEWTGVLGFTSDGRPIVGELPGRPGVLVAAGFCGHGMPQCYGVEEHRAMIAGEHERVDPHVRERMDPARFVSAHAARAGVSSAVLGALVATTTKARHRVPSHRQEFELDGNPNSTTCDGALRMRGATRCESEAKAVRTAEGAGQSRRDLGMRGNSPR